MKITDASRLPRPISKRMTGAALLLLATVALPQCSKTMLDSPTILGGNENTVSIEAGKITNPYDFAQKYCERFGKHAVKIGSTAITDSDITRLYGYDCVSEHR